MQTWKKIVIASSATLIVGIGVYYIIQSQRIKKIKDRGFIINVSTVQEQRTNIPTFPEDSNGNEREIIANAAGEFTNVFKKIFGLQ
jgi:hypothetical protein